VKQQADAYRQTTQLPSRGCALGVHAGIQYVRRIHTHHACTGHMSPPACASCNPMCLEFATSASGVTISCPPVVTANYVAPTSHVAPPALNPALNTGATSITVFLGFATICTCMASNDSISALECFRKYLTQRLPQSHLYPPSCTQVPHRSPCSWALPPRTLPSAGSCKSPRLCWWPTPWASCPPSAPTSTRLVCASAASTLHITLASCLSAAW
jgi:hypothetical protein